MTTNVVIFTIEQQRLKVLLVRRPRAPFQGVWALPGGFIAMADGLEQSALQALERETGMHGVFLEQLYTFGRPDRDPRERVITVAYYALVPSDRLTRRAHSDVDWFAVDTLPELAFDHRDIVELAIARLAAKLDYSTIAFQFMPREFTLGELQAVYEVILGEPLDKRNFRKRVLALAHIEAVGQARRQGSHRPAMLYKVKHPERVEIISGRRSR